MSEIRVNQVENGYIVQETDALTRMMVFATLDEVMQEMLRKFENRYAGMGGDSFGRVTIDRGGKEKPRTGSRRRESERTS